MCPAAAGGGPPVQKPLVFAQARWAGQDARIQRFNYALRRNDPVVTNAWSLSTSFTQFLPLRLAL